MFDDMDSIWCLYFIYCIELEFWNLLLKIYYFDSNWSNIDMVESTSTSGQRAHDGLDIQVTQEVTALC